MSYQKIDLYSRLATGSGARVHQLHREMCGSAGGPCVKLVAQRSPSQLRLPLNAQPHKDSVVCIDYYLQQLIQQIRLYTRIHTTEELAVLVGHTVPFDDELIPRQL